MSDSRRSHYDVLGVRPRATREQLDRAYRFLCDMYDEGALATYSLLGSEELERVRRRIQEAYEVLSHPRRRREYDLSRGYVRDGEPTLPFEPSAEAENVEEMRSEPSTDRASREVLPEPVTGADLQRVREERGVSLEEIASVSKIGVRYLRYIESDRHSLLPAVVYLRGFLKEYAKAVGLEPDRTAKSYLARLRDG
jgi:flagellar biosynthesis protein FlhG